MLLAVAIVVISAAIIGAMPEDCSVPRILNGNIIEQVRYEEWCWFIFGYKKKVKLEIVDTGVIPSTKAELFLVCHKGYYIEGKGTTVAAISCSTGGWSPKHECLKKIQCPRIDQADEFNIVYSDYRRIHSIAFFSCRNKKQKITRGLNTRTCLPTGLWSGGNPECEEIPLSDDTTAVSSTQSPGRSTVTVYKTAPIVPTVPVPPANCFCTYNSNDRSLFAAVNGQRLWSGDKVRGGEIPEISCIDRSMQLVLPNASRVSGSIKLTCNACQTWEDTDLPSCQPVLRGASGCHLDVRDISPSLIIKPAKEYFSLGECIILSCPIDQELTKNVGRVMCLGTTWSDEFPRCRERKIF